MSKLCMNNMQDCPTYRDVTIIVNGETYSISGDYRLSLECTRIAGWRLFQKWQQEEVLVGGEYDSNEFMIFVDEIKICDAKEERFGRDS